MFNRRFSKLSIDRSVANQSNEQVTEKISYTHCMSCGLKRPIATNFEQCSNCYFLKNLLRIYYPSNGKKLNAPYTYNGMPFEQRENKNFHDIPVFSPVSNEKIVYHKSPSFGMLLANSGQQLVAKYL